MHHFSMPLEKADIDTSMVKDEWDDMILYSKQYLILYRMTTRLSGGSCSILILNAGAMYWVLLNYCFVSHSPMVT